MLTPEEDKLPMGQADADKRSEIVADTLNKYETGQVKFNT